MFGKMNVIPVVDLRNAPDNAGRCADGAVKRLLDVTENPKIEKWGQFPKALFVFLIVPGDPESGAFYVYDRLARIWFWVDFDAEKFGGYPGSDFDRLAREGHALAAPEDPRLVAGSNQWLVH